MKERRQRNTASMAKRDERRKKPLMTVSKSKAQLHFSTVIAFPHEHPEHPHNNQRHFGGILVSP